MPTCRISGRISASARSRSTGREIAVKEETVASHPFCNLVHFRKDWTREEPTVLVVAPLSGHFSTLLRGTVETLLADHNVYLTDWKNARDVPLLYGRFDLDDFVELVIRFTRLLGPRIHVMAVCQPSVPVLAAVSLMAAGGDPCQPASMILMGGPIDTRVNPTAVNRFAEAHDARLVRAQVITTVPARYPGAVPPSLSGVSAARRLSQHEFRPARLGALDDVSRPRRAATATARRRPAPSTTNTARSWICRRISICRRSSACFTATTCRWPFAVRGELVEPAAIERTALMTVEGERDDVCGPGQTVAAHDLCTGLPPAKKTHHLQLKVGHYGVFHGRRWQTETYPKVKSFIRAQG